MNFPLDMKTKQVKDLVSGDKLSDGTEIIGRPLELAHTPKGKMEVAIRRPDGTKRAVLWGKYTTMFMSTKAPSARLWNVTTYARVYVFDAIEELDNFRKFWNCEDFKCSLDLETAI